MSIERVFLTNACSGSKLIGGVAAASPNPARRAKLILLTKWLPEAISAGGGSLEWISGGPGSKSLIFGPLYYDAPQTWSEFFRCLHQLDPTERKHLISRFHAGHTARKRLPFREHRRSGILQHREPVALPSCSELIAVGGAEGPERLMLSCVLHFWPAWVSNILVDEALSSLDASFRGSIDLPRDLIAA